MGMGSFIHLTPMNKVEQIVCDIYTARSLEILMISKTRF